MINRSALLVVILGLAISRVLANDVEYVTVTRSVSFTLKSIPEHPTGTVRQKDGTLEFLSRPEQIPLKKERPFVAVVIQWEAPLTKAHQIELSIRGSEDGINWTDWLQVGEDHHATPGLNRFSGELQFLPAESRWIQYRATTPVNASILIPPLENVFLHFINPGITPKLADAPKRETQKQTSVTTQQGFSGLPNSEATTMSASYSLPEYVDRVKWGASLNLTNSAPRTPTTVTHLIVHHSAGQNTANDFAAVVRSYYILHTQTNGWTDIGYNWLIDRNGVLYQGRAFDVNGSIDVVGAHLGGGNTNTMGVCLIGDFTSTQPTTGALTQLRNVLAWKANERKIDVRTRQPHTLGNLFTISGHRDGVATECPGNAFYPRLPEIRSRVHAYLNPPQLLSNKLTVTSSKPTEATVEVAIHPKGSDVVGYIEYGTNVDQLTSKTALFELKASESMVATSVTIKELAAGTRYFYRVVASNSEIVQKFEVSNFVAGVTTTIEETNDSPRVFALEQNFPNPFNPTTTIAFSLPVPGNVKLVVYNLFGQTIKVLVNNYRSKGKHQVHFDGNGLPSGVWYYALEVNGQLISTKKMTLLK